MGSWHMMIISAIKISVHSLLVLHFPLLLPLPSNFFFSLFAQNKYQEPYPKSKFHFIDKIMQEQC